MYGKANYSPPIGQGSQPPPAAQYQQNLPFQSGPPLYPQSYPNNGSQLQNSSHFGPQNVNQNPMAVQYLSHGGSYHPPPPPPQMSLPPPPPPPRPGSEMMNLVPQFSTTKENNGGEEVEELCTIAADDSDMEMEDDITLTDKDPADNSTEILSNARELGEKDRSIAPAPESLPDHRPAHCITSGNVGSTSIHTTEVHAVDVVLSADTSLNAYILDPKKNSDFVKVVSPMRLLQDYASDGSDNGGELLQKDSNLSDDLTSNVAAKVAPCKYTRSTLEADTVAKSQNNTKKGKAADDSLTSTRNVKAGNLQHIITERAGGGHYKNAENQKSLRDDTSIHAKDILNAGGVHDTSKTCNAQKESLEKKAQSNSASIKVDEFGRLLREASDSDRDSGYGNRHKRKTSRYLGRSRSRSRSPLDRRRTKSSRRRNNERSRSRSWSPRNRRSRSRSRSPTNRRAGDFNDGKIRNRRSRSRSPRNRRNRSRSPSNRSSRSKSPTTRHVGEFSDGKFRSKKGRGSECYDFLKGKCYRGASCRFMHHTVSKNESSRSYRSSKHSEIPSGMNDHKTRDETKNIHIKLPEIVRNETLVEEIQGGKVDRKGENTIRDPRQTNLLDHSDELVNPNMVEHQSLREVIGTPRQMRIILDKSSAPILQLHDDETLREKSNLPPSADKFPSESMNGALLKYPETHQPQSSSSAAEDRKAVCPSHQVNDSSIAPPIQTTSNSPKTISTSEPALNNVVPTVPLPWTSSSHPLAYDTVTVQFPDAKEISPPCFPGPIVSHEPFSHGPKAPNMQRMPMSYNLAPNAMSYPIQFSHGMNPRNYQVSPANQYPQFSAPPNSTWNLPPPPPRPPYNVHFTSSAPSQFEPSHFPPNNGLNSQIPVRSFPAEGISSSHQELPYHNFQLEGSVSGIPRSQFGAPGLLREDRFSHLTVQEPSTSTSSRHANLHEQSIPPSEEGPGNLHQQSVPSSQDLSGTRVLPSLSDPSFGDSRLSMPGKAAFVSQYMPDQEDGNKFASGYDFGVPRIVPHHNPYASTFEQPLGSKFGSAFSQVISRNQYDITSRHVNANEPGACGDQYNPLVDSVELTSSDKKIESHSRNWDPTSDSNRKEIGSGSYDKPLDLNEISKNEDLAVVSNTSLDNDNFGETADAEIGAVDNESLSDLAGVMTPADIETKSNSPGEKQAKKKKKKKKDSRSTKPFKMAIADFVKDVLKPSWRQGNMSKEAFKTIVKKTVDKVSGAMKAHSVPKSQSKIDHYIDSSQRKLTKLVMGYVDKYVKA